MKLLLDNSALDQLVEEIQNRIIIKIETERSDRLLNKRQLCEKLGCSLGELERKYLSRPGFPRLKPHIDGIREVYSDVEVD